MKRFQITEAEYEAIKAKESATKDKNISRRLRVLMLRYEGKKVEEIGQILHLERILSRNILSIKKSCTFPFYNPIVLLEFQTKINWHCRKHFLSATVPVCLCFSFLPLNLYT